MVDPGPPILRRFAIDGRWCIHSYYTLNPYAPDGTDRVLMAAADPATRLGKAVVFDQDARPIWESDPTPLGSGFWHTGLWQAWGPGARSIFYRDGTLESPRAHRIHLSTSAVDTVEQEFEGNSPYNDVIIAGSHAMLYAAGYSSRQYTPEASPYPFQDRDRHGLFSLDFAKRKSKLLLSTAEVMSRLDLPQALNAADREVRLDYGADDGLTLMCYCVRWNRQGTRLLFFLGNHTVSRCRREPKIAYIVTADAEAANLNLAVDLSFGRWGLHWGWHPDGEHLIGYGPGPGRMPREERCLAIVHHTGRGYRKLASHQSGGHPSLSPTCPDLLVTDSYGRPGQLEFIDVSIDRVIASYPIDRSWPRGAEVAPGRHPGVVDLHPVFHPSGDRVLINHLPGPYAEAIEIAAPKL